MGDFAAKRSYQGANVMHLGLIAQAVGGLIFTTSQDGEFLAPAGAVIADSAGRQNLCISIVAAIFARTHTGRGRRVDASLLGGQIWAQAAEMRSNIHSGDTSKLWEILST